MVGGAYVWVSRRGTASPLSDTMRKPGGDNRNQPRLAPDITKGGWSECNLRHSWLRTKCFACLAALREIHSTRLATAGTATRNANYTLRVQASAWNPEDWQSAKVGPRPDTLIWPQSGYVSYIVIMTSSGAVPDRALGYGRAVET